MLISRDSWLWWFGLVGAVVTAIMVNLEQFAWFSDSARHWISLGAVIVAAISGKLATSPLPGDKAVTIAEATAKIEDGKDQLKKVETDPHA